MKITVTKKDIQAGQPCMCEECPIALAIKRQTKTDYVKVGVAYCDVNGKEYKLPISAQKFICDFDDFANTKPFSFTLRRSHDSN